MVNLLFACFWPCLVFLVTTQNGGYSQCSDFWRFWLILDLEVYTSESFILVGWEFTASSIISVLFLCKLKAWSIEKSLVPLSPDLVQFQFHLCILIHSYCMSVYIINVSKISAVSMTLPSTVKREFYYSIFLKSMWFIYCFWSNFCSSHGRPCNTEYGSALVRFSLDDVVTCV